MQVLDINGTPVELDKITEFRVVKVEYIYSPSYVEKTYVREEVRDFIGRVKTPSASWVEYAFARMIPYGAIIGEEGKPTIAGFYVKDFRDAIIHDIKADFGRIGEVGARLFSNGLRIDRQQFKKYLIQRPNGRIENISLSDIPFKLLTSEGQEIDVYQNDEWYKKLGKAVSHSRNILPALFVRADDKPYLFVGKGIDVDDVTPYYEALRGYQETKLEQKKQARVEAGKKKSLFALPKVEIPQIRFQLPITFVDDKKKTEAADKEKEREGE